jgi:poly(hydroxyalkanoate) depolymerase family esterase
MNAKNGAADPGINSGMNRYRAHVLAVAAFSLGLLVPVRGWAAALVEVTRSDWAGTVSLPSYMQMYIYVPDKLATKPPIYVSCHSCGSTATGQISNIPMAKAAADAQGFILVLPDNPGRNCWDVGTTKSLTHDGGGDTQAVALMVKYALSKYSGDAGRVYIMGGSGGAMLVQAMLAVYPDVFRAGAARAGVPAGCWADGYSDSNQWSNNCAAGNTIKTAQQWGDLVRAMYPGYSGHRPRLQTYQGDADTTISYKNTGEAIKEWTNVLGLSMTPTSMDTGYKTSQASWNRQFWSNACGYTVFEAWTAPGATHSMSYEEAEMLKFFGLTTAGGSDPEPNCNGDGGVAGASGSGGTTGAGGAGGARDGGTAGRDGGTDAGTPGTGGVQGTGGAVAGAAGTSGTAGTGGRSGSGGAGTTGSAGSGAAAGTSGTAGTGASGAAGTGASGAAGTVGTGGSSAGGGSSGAGAGGTPGGGGAGTQGGIAGSGSGGSTGIVTPPNGCSCAVGSGGERSAFPVATMLLAAFGLILRRQRRRRR